MQNILVIRFSALGDVTIAAHLIKASLDQNPNSNIFILTKPQFRPIFKLFLPDKNIITPDLKNYKGFFGLAKLAQFLSKNYNFDTVADIHSVIRSWIIDFFLFFHGKKIFIINKQKKLRRSLTKLKNKKLRPLTPVYILYKKTLQKTGLNINLNQYKPNFNFPNSLNIQQFISQNKFNIGIAPFAAHKSKQYPLDKMLKIITYLNNSNKFNIIIFGGGKKEETIAANWEKNFKNLKSSINKIPLDQQIALMKKLDLIITMDSGNMHLASLTNTPNITIWGATHPFMGFIPVYNWNPKLAIQKNIPCRPCSVFGSDKCPLNNFQCLDIDPIIILRKIFSTLNIQTS